MQKFRIKCRFCYVLRVFRETAVCEKSEQRSRHAIEGLSRRFLVVANVLSYVFIGATDGSGNTFVAGPVRRKFDCVESLCCFETVSVMLCSFSAVLCYF